MTKQNEFLNAVTNGRTDVVRALLTNPCVDPSANGNRAIFYATLSGNIEILRVLLADPRVDPSAEDNDAIRWAVKKGHTGIIRVLLMDPRVDPSAAIQWAASRGHTDIVRAALADPRVDPSTRWNTLIHWAAHSGHTDIVKVLLADHRVWYNPMPTCCEAHVSRAWKESIKTLLLVLRRAGITRLSDVVRVHFACVDSLDWSTRRWNTR